MVSAAQLKAQSKYDKTHTRAVMLKLNLQSDADVLAVLDHVENRQGYIKELIRKDLRECGETLSREAISFLIIPVARKYRLERLYLFGSYARGEEAKDSDVDLAYEGGDIRSLLELADLKDALKSALGKEVDVVELNSVYEERASRSSRRFKEHFEREKVLIYDAVG